MLRNSRAWLVPLVLVCAAATARAQAVAPQPAPSIETARLESKLTGRAMPYNVLLPADYASPASKATRYPVIYLLHGLTGSYKDWLTRSKLSEHAAPYRLIIVTPEGANGWYTDSASDPADKYESYILRELIPEIDARYRTVASREGRAVAGLSMGGYGALKFGVKHPEQFAFAGSMSGAVGVASWRAEGDVPERLRPFILRTFGGADNPVKISNDLFRLVRELPEGRLASLPFLYLDCGTEDQLQLLAPNRALADLLVERKIAHEYRQLPGGHTWPYWDRQVREVLRLASEKLRAAPAAAATAPPARAETRRPR